MQGQGWLTCEELWWDGQGRLRTVVDQVFPMSRVHDALAYLDGRRNFGKVVMSIVPDAESTHAVTVAAAPAHWSAEGFSNGFWHGRAGIELEGAPA